jgi:hypothetical protein
MRPAGLAVVVGCALALVAACPPAAPAPAPPGPAAPPGPPIAEPTPPPAPAPTPAPVDAGAPAAPTGACDSADDCPSGVCEGLGCGTGEGRCVPENRACTRDLRPYCGCDGETFQASGSCPGQRYAYRGACAAPRADNQPCASDDQCASGVCEGQGCGDDETGLCVPTGRMCTADVREYCGCNGTTFTASGSCPGRRYAHRGACK